MVRRLGKILLWLVVVVCFASAIVPRYLDRRYWQGPETAKFDGERFFNPDGDADTAGPPTGGGRIGFLWRNLTGRDGRPPWPDHVPVRPARPSELLQPTSAPATAAPVGADGLARVPMRATWIGHASVLVQTPGLNILTDPVWSERTGPFGFGPRRVTAPGIALADLPRIDVILISHNHYDHLDLKTLKRIWTRDQPLIVTARGNEAILSGAGIAAIAADWGEAVPINQRPGAEANGYAARPARVIVTRNHHWSSRWFADRNRALWSSFVVTLPGGNLFFAGDTGMGDGRWPAEAAAFGPIRLALIPIGAFRFRPDQMESGSHIGPAQAVQVFAGLGAATGIPIHWGTFRLSYEAYRTPPNLLRLATDCAGIPRQRFAPVQIGRPVDIPPIGARRPVTISKAALDRCMKTPAARVAR